MAATKLGSIEGVVHYDRSDPDSGRDCICCKGLHIFAMYARFDGDYPEKWPYHQGSISASDFLHDQISARKQTPWDLEGKTIRVTVEVVED